MQNINKEIIKRNFGRAAREYETNARLQLKVAEELINQCHDFYGEVLDLGAGPGIIRKQSKWNVTELDISYEMCRASGGIVVNADIEQIPFKNESFDNVVSSLSLQWLGSREKAFSEIYKVLKPAGKFAFSTFSPNSLIDLAMAFAEMDNEQHVLEFEPLIRVYSVLKKIGFRDIVVNSQKITYEFEDIFSALNSIKNIGATYNFEGAGKGLKTVTYFNKLENIYREICKTSNVPIRWEVLYFKCVK